MRRRDSLLTQLEMTDETNRQSLKGGILPAESRLRRKTSLLGVLTAILNTPQPGRNNPIHRGHDSHKTAESKRPRHWEAPTNVDAIGSRTAGTGIGTPRGSFRRRGNP